VLCLYQLRVEAQQVATLRIKAPGQPPTLTLATDKQWHLFLSHNWANQDVVATIKRQLQLLLPGVQVFLDVDNLERIDDLERYIEASQATLVLLGCPSYFTSRNCLREARTALAKQQPLVRVHDADISKGGATLERLEIQCPRDLEERLFPEGRPPIPWHRGREFQLCALAAIAEELLLASPAYAHGQPSMGLFVEGAVAWMECTTLGESVRLYVSPHNPACDEAIRELQGRLGPLTLVHSVEAATHSLLFLTPTCFQDVSGERLAAEVVMMQQHEVVMVYSAEQVPEFREIIDATPKELVDGGLYSSLAIEWHVGRLGAVSVGLVAQALEAQGPGGCTRACEHAGACMKAFRGERATAEGEHDRARLRGLSQPSTRQEPSHHSSDAAVAHNGL